MALTVPTTEYLDAVTELLADGASAVAVPVKGGSMRPFLSEEDTVYLAPVSSPPRSGDIILYRRPCGRYILHRVYRVKNGSYSMLGDSQSQPEHGISSDQLLAIAVAADRRGKRIYPTSPVWRCYACVWRRSVRLRKLLFRFAGLVRR